MEGGRVRLSHSQGRYGVVPPKAPDIVAISVLQIRPTRHTVGTRHPLRFPSYAASVEERRVMANAKASHVGALTLGKRPFDISSGRDVLTSFSRTCWMRGLQKGRMRDIHAGGSSVLSGESLQHLVKLDGQLIRYLTGHIDPEL